MSNVTTELAQGMPQIIKIDEDKVHHHLNKVVRQSVEDTLNQMLDAEADRLPVSVSLNFQLPINILCQVKAQMDFD